MNKNSYDMPLQNLYPKINSRQTNLPIQQISIPIQTEQDGSYDQTEEEKYNLPCQRINELFGLEQKKKENRPVMMRNPFQASKINYSQQAKTTEIEASKITMMQSLVGDRERARVSSVYERLLEENKKQCPINDCLLTETTFKPSELSRQLKRHHSVRELSSKPSKSFSTTNMKGAPASMKGKQFSKKLQNAKKLEYEQKTKTKYEKILEEHFNTKANMIKKQSYMNPSDIRLSKICGKNSAIMKLKERLQPISLAFQTTRQSKLKKQASKQSVFVKSLTEKQSSPQRKKNISQSTKKTVDFQKKQPLIKQSQHIQNERWMSMNFYQRQQRVLSNRKQKQQLGKQQKIQKEIKPCTFKPELTKPKTQRTEPSQKNSYLEQYYGRLYRKY